MIGKIKVSAGMGKGNIEQGYQANACGHGIEITNNSISFKSLNQCA